MGHGTRVPQLMFINLNLKAKNQKAVFTHMVNGTVKIT